MAPREPQAPVAQQARASLWTPSGSARHLHQGSGCHHSTRHVPPSSPTTKIKGGGGVKEHCLSRLGRPGRNCTRHRSWDPEYRALTLQHQKHKQPG